MNITGTMVNYFFHCKRQLWLFANKINLEENSENVRIGKVLHEIKHDGKKRVEWAIDNIKIDQITDDYLVEYKKSDADIEAVKWQTLFYLKKLKDKGIVKKGRIEFEEAKKQHRKTIILKLTEELENDIDNLECEITQLILSKFPPLPINKSKCKRCAYYTYCYV